MKKYYFDMDGVLADFDGQPNALDRFIVEPGFFQQLEPTRIAHELNDLLHDEKMRENIYILSASPNTRADIDKVLWIFEHLPNFKLDNIIIVRGGQGADERKAVYANAEAILFDDYSGNLLSWVAKGGKGIKVINDRNGTGRKWKGDRLIQNEGLAHSLSAIQ